MSSRGVGSIKRLGGGAPTSRGTFGMKRAPKKIFLVMLATGVGEGEGGRKKNPNHIIFHA
jgi:hypothetical protein